MHSDQMWAWSDKCAESLQHAKEHLTSAQLCTCYDLDLPITLTTDASAYVLRVLIPHSFPDRSERPVGIVSRILHTCEKNYFQLDKEVLSLIFGVRKFHQICMVERSPWSPTTSLQWLFWAWKRESPLWLVVLFSICDYVIHYKSTNTHGNANGLSRLGLGLMDLHASQLFPRPSMPWSRLLLAKTTSSGTDSVSTFNIGQIQALPNTVNKIKKGTTCNDVLNKVFTYIWDGWPQQVEKDSQPCNTCQTETNIEGGCLMWCLRVIAHKALQPAMLKSLHETHPGISQMKATSCSYFWWSGLNQDIEALGKGNEACQSMNLIFCSTPRSGLMHCGKERVVAEGIFLRKKQ